MLVNSFQKVSFPGSLIPGVAYKKGLNPFSIYVMRQFKTDYPSKRFSEILFCGKKNEMTKLRVNICYEKNSFRKRVIYGSDIDMLLVADPVRRKTVLF